MSPRATLAQLAMLAGIIKKPEAGNPINGPEWALFEEINAHLASRGQRLRRGMIVDASIIEAPSSTKNRRGWGDPEMHQTKKGNEWHFGMKAHMGVDAETGLTHSLATTAANAQDVTLAGALLHGGECEAWGDAGYEEVAKRPEHCGRDVEWRVEMRPGRRRRLDPDGAEAASQKRQASMRAKVEHPFLYLKRHFRLRQGALPVTGEEHATDRLAAGVRESAHCRTLCAGLTTRGQSARIPSGSVKPAAEPESGAPIRVFLVTTDISREPLRRSINHRSRVP